MEKPPLEPECKDGQPEPTVEPQHIWDGSACSAPADGSGVMLPDGYRISRQAIALICAAELQKSRFMSNTKFFGPN